MGNTRCSLKKTVKGGKQYKECAIIAAKNKNFIKT